MAGFAFKDKRTAERLKQFANKQPLSPQKNTVPDLVEIKKPHYNGYVVKPVAEIAAADGDGPGIGDAYIYAYDFAEEEFTQHLDDGGNTVSISVCNLSSSALSTDDFFFVSNEIISGRRVVLPVGS